MKTEYNSFFAEAPGRLDVMGGISDYSGALVLQMALKQTTKVTISPTESGLLELETREAGQIHRFHMPMQHIYDWLDQPAKIRDFVGKEAHQEWARYPIACLAVLAKYKHIRPTGFRLSIQSEVPTGKGVSSSAALELACLRALTLAYPFPYQDLELARLGQKAENEYVGAPCGLMDQLASSFGQAGKLLPILCRPDQIFPLVDLPDNVFVVGIDSGVRHAITEASYADVRTAAAMGYALICQKMGKSARQIAEKVDLPFNGYLTQIDPSLFLQEFDKILPHSLSGRQFQSQLGQVADSLANWQDTNQYAIHACTLHPIQEHHRSRVFLSLLKQFPENQADQINTLDLMGELMYQSHASYSKVGLGHKQTNRLVEMARQSRPAQVFGAKITGGGSGGTVCFLAHGRQGLEAVRAIHKQYQEEIGTPVELIDPMGVL